MVPDFQLLLVSSQIGTMFYRLLAWHPVSLHWYPFYRAFKYSEISVIMAAEFQLPVADFPPLFCWISKSCSIKGCYR